MLRPHAALTVCTAEVHERKPELPFYRHVLQETGVNPSRTLFVDDKVENVVTARSMGLQGLLFDSAENVMKKIRNLVCDPIERSQDWLRVHSRCCTSISSRGDIVQENLAHLMVLEITGDESRN